MPTCSRLGFAAMLALACSFSAAGCATEVSEDAVESGDELRGATSMLELLAQVPPGTPWKDVKPWIRARLMLNAEAVYAKVRHEWGQRGLDEKEERILESPNAAMIENFDRVLKFVLAPDIPETFTPSTDITNPELATQMRRFYLAYVAGNRGALLDRIPGVKDWDGGDILNMYIYVPSANDALVSYVTDIENKIRAIPENALTDVEQALVKKAFFTTRAMRSNVFNHAGWAPGWLWNFVLHYKSTPENHIYKDDEEFLLYLNAVTFQPLHFVNKGTVDAFNWDYESYVDPGLLSDYELPPDSPAGQGFFTLSRWWAERLNDHPAAKNKCTVYSKTARNIIWENFTAVQRTNADGSETFEGYAASYEATAAARRNDIKQTAVDAIEAAFGGPSSMLTPSQKSAVLAAIQAETRPAAILDTIYATLDNVTGSTAASDALKAQFDDLEIVGGNYAPGDPVRPEDEATVKAMWANLKAFLASHYGGLTVDIAALAPAEVSITTNQATYAAAPGVVNVGLADPTNKATLYSTLLHEAKHAIDFASKAPVQGAAWEGAATLAEQMVSPTFLDEVMSSPADQKRLPFYRLANQIEFVRLTATTDATLKVFLRNSCGNGQPDTIDFAKNIVRSYGYDDEPTLLLRSRRAHYGPQYLEYDYGQVQYAGIVQYFQAQIGPSKTIDPFVLQACDLTTPARNAAAVNKLKACLGLP